MKKIMTFFVKTSICFLLFSCKEPFATKSNFNTDLENQVSKEYYSKDVSASFSKFLENPEEIARSCRSALADDEERELTDEEMFAGLWDSLTEEEKQKVMENLDSVELSLNGIVAVDEDSSVGRAALAGDSSGLDNIAAMYGFMQKLNDWFKEYTISNDLMPESLRFNTQENIPLVPVMEYCVQNELWSDVEKILCNIDTNITVDELKNEYELFNSSSNESEISNRAAILVGYEDEELIENLGATLKDGTVILTSPKEKAFLIAGKWQHAGIFSKLLFDRNGQTDATHCVYTAQPDDYADFPEDMKPDNPGYACLDTIYMYTRQKRLATLLPKSYTNSKGAEAVNYAKTIYYDKKPEYCLPWWEMLGINDSSHDEGTCNTYCSKVVYTGWKKAGVDLDAETFAGNLVSPDDLYGSGFNVYRTVTIRFLWWSKSWTEKIYSGTSYIQREVSQ